MATVYGVNATLNNNTSTRHQSALPVDEQGGRIRWITDSYECVATASGTDIILGGKVPKDAQILPGSYLYHDDMGAGGGTLSVGTSVAGVDLAALEDVGTAAGNVQLNHTIDLFGTKTSAAVNVHVTPTFEMTGTIRLSLLYAMA